LRLVACGLRLGLLPLDASRISWRGSLNATYPASFIADPRLLALQKAYFKQATRDQADPRSDVTPPEIFNLEILLGSP